MSRMTSMTWMNLTTSMTKMTRITYNIQFNIQFKKKGSQSVKYKLS